MESETRAQPFASRLGLFRGISLGALLVWMQLAFRLAPAPLISLPIEALSHPRADEAWLAATTTLVIASFACALFARRRTSMRPQRPRIRIRRIAAVALAVIGSLSLASSPSSIMLIAGSGILTGLGLLSMLFDAFEVIASLSDSSATQSVLIALVFSCLLNIVLFLLPAAIALYAVPFLPIASLLNLRDAQGMRDCANVQQPETSKGDRPQHPRKVGQELLAETKDQAVTLAVVFFMFAFVMGFLGFEADVFQPKEQIAYQCLIMASGCAIALIISLFAKRAPSGAFSTLLLLSLATAVIIMPITDSPFAQFVAVALAQGALAAAYSAQLLLVGHIKSNQRRRRAAFLAIGCTALCQLLGILIGGIIRSIFGTDITVLSVASMAVLYLVLMVVVPAAHRTHRVEHIVKSPYATEEELARIKRDQIVERFPQLSPRESDVLYYLLQGYSNARIAEALVVSDNTVKTHVRHVFEKTGVSSRQELLALADNVRLSLAKDEKTGS